MNDNIEYEMWKMLFEAKRHAHRHTIAIVMQMNLYMSKMIIIAIIIITGIDFIFWRPSIAFSIA